MVENEWLAERFEGNRAHLRGVAYRMLGSLTEADDAVQESWIRLSRSDANAIENLGGWLTTVVARVCLDMLRTRRSRREEFRDAPLDAAAGDSAASGAEAASPEDEVVLADSVGLAMLVVLETLTPPERVAFVLHDMFAVPFDDIATIVGRSTTATRQLASRARGRVQGASPSPEGDLGRQREIVDAFLAASRDGEFEALLAMLDPDVVVRSDAVAMAVGGGPRELRGAAAVARSFTGKARTAKSALIDGVVGVVVAPRGKLFLALGITIVNGKIVGIDAIADPAHLARLDINVFEV